MEILASWLLISKAVETIQYGTHSKALGPWKTGEIMTKKLRPNNGAIWLKCDILVSRGLNSESRHNQKIWCLFESSWVKKK